MRSARARSSAAAPAAPAAAATPPTTAAATSGSRRSPKKSLELALREALVAGDRHIGAEHVLLGLLRDEKAEAAAVLRRTNTPVDAVRDALRPAGKQR